MSIRAEVARSVESGLQGMRVRCRLVDDAVDGWWDIEVEDGKQMLVRQEVAKWLRVLKGGLAWQR